jgi:predicted NAD/FAD-dependent oxidoreductase
MSTIAIIGAGVAGVSAARALREKGRDVHVFDENPSIGGRLISPSLFGELTIDTGAQFFQARSDVFKAEIERLEKVGVVKAWNPRLGVIKDQTIEPFGLPEKLYVGVPHMASVFREWGNGLSVIFGEKILGLEKNKENAWLLKSQRTTHGPFSWVIFACPPERVLELLPRGCNFKREVMQVKMTACWSVVLDIRSSTQIPFDASYIKKSDMTLILRYGSKPDRPQDPQLWVVHMSNPWSFDHARTPKEDVCDSVAMQFRNLPFLRNAERLRADAVLWKDASPVKTLKQPCLIDASKNLAAYNN